jgi:hypothetical protein
MMATLEFSVLLGTVSSSLSTGLSLASCTTLGRAAGLQQLWEALDIPDFGGAEEKQLCDMEGEPQRTNCLPHSCRPPGCWGGCIPQTPPPKKPPR